MQSSLHTQITRMADLVAYQEGSVSRMIINKPTGTVTVFAFDLREGLNILLLMMPLCIFLMVLTMVRS